MVLAISVCYHARLQDREEYEEGVTEQIYAGTPDLVNLIRDELRW